MTKLGINCLQLSNCVPPTDQIVKDPINDRQLLGVFNAAAAIAELTAAHGVPCGLLPLQLLISIPIFAKASSAVCLIATVKKRKLCFAYFLTNFPKIIILPKKQVKIPAEIE